MHNYTTDVKNDMKMARNPKKTCGFIIEHLFYVTQEDIFG